MPYSNIYNPLDALARSRQNPLLNNQRMPEEIPLKVLIEQYGLDVPVVSSLDRQQRDANLQQLLRSDKNAVRRLVESGKLDTGEQELLAKDQEQMNRADEADNGVNIDKNRMATRLQNAFRQGEQLRMNRMGNYQNNLLRNRYGGGYL